MWGWGCRREGAGVGISVGIYWGCSGWVFTYGTGMCLVGVLSKGC